MRSCKHDAVTITFDHGLDLLKIYGTEEFKKCLYGQAGQNQYY